MIRIAVAEDEESSRKQLREYAERFSRETDTAMEVLEFSNGIQLTEGYKAFDRKEEMLK